MQNSKSRVVDIEQTNSDAVNEKDIVLQTVPQKPANGKIVLPFANGIAETLFERYSLRNFAKSCYAYKNLTPRVRPFA